MGSFEEAFKFPIVAWSKVCWPVEVGVLGIWRIGLFNQALLGKWLWRFGCETNRLWCQVIASKYGETSGGWCTRVGRGSQGCGMGKNIRKGAKSFFGHMLYVVGEGLRIRLWYDLWCGHIPLKDLYPDLFSHALGKDVWISELITITSDGGSRSWNIQFHQAPNDWEVERVDAFYEHIYSKMRRGVGVDSLFWKLTPNGVFDVRSFYNSLSAPPTISFPWKCIWSSKVPKRVSFFLWTATQDSILTIDNLGKRNLHLVNSCCLCRCDGETVDHLLLYCKFANAL